MRVSRFLLWLIRWCILEVCSLLYFVGKSGFEGEEKVIGIGMTGISESLFWVGLAGVGVTFLLVSLVATIVAMGWWYIVIVGVALAVMWYTKNLLAAIMAMLAIAGAIAWVQLSGWPDTWTLAVTATFICLLSLCILFVLRHHTEVFD